MFVFPDVFIVQPGRLPARLRLRRWWQRHLTRDGRALARRLEGWRLPGPAEGEAARTKERPAVKRAANTRRVTALQTELRQYTRRTGGRGEGGYDERNRDERERD